MQRQERTTLAAIVSMRGPRPRYPCCLVVWDVARVFPRASLCWPLAGHQEAQPLLHSRPGILVRSTLPRHWPAGCLSSPGVFLRGPCSGIPWVCCHSCIGRGLSVHLGPNVIRSQRGASWLYSSCPPLPSWQSEPSVVICHPHSAMGPRELCCRGQPRQVTKQGCACDVHDPHPACPAHGGDWHLLQTAQWARPSLARGLISSRRTCRKGWLGSPAHELPWCFLCSAACEGSCGMPTWAQRRFLACWCGESSTARGQDSAVVASAAQGDRGQRMPAALLWGPEVSQRRQDNGMPLHPAHSRCGASPGVALFGAPHCCACGRDNY